MANNRAYVEERLAEINTRANAREPSMSYWKALQAAARSNAARLRAREKDVGATD